jgi:CIC family chloride channel protein
MRKSGDFVAFLLRSALVGIGAGLVAVAFRLGLNYADSWRSQMLNFGHTLQGPGWLLLPVVGGAAAALAGWLTGFAPEAAGSGIPHVEAVLNQDRELKWWRLIPVKFVAGTLAIGAGLSLGREGPTVQMGAAAGQAVGERLRLSRAEELQLVACGAGAGLAASFNAPLAGVVFVLEELRRNFSPYVLGGAFAASIAADMISLLIVGPLPTFRVASLQPLPLTTLPLFLVLGLVTGVLGAAFNRCLRGSLDLADRLANVPRWARAGLTGFLAGLAGYLLRQILGGGHALVMDLLSGRIALAFGLLAVLFGGKFLLTMASYAAGVPGGIFLPLLTLGALLGAIVGWVATTSTQDCLGWFPRW